MLGTGDGSPGPVPQAVSIWNSLSKSQVAAEDSRHVYPTSPPLLQDQGSAVVSLVHFVHESIHYVCETGSTEPPLPGTIFPS